MGVVQITILGNYSAGGSHECQKGIARVYLRQLAGDKVYFADVSS